MKSKVTISGLAAVVVLVAAIFFCVWTGRKVNEKFSDLNPDQPAPQGRQRPSSPPTAQSDHLALGNPSNAVTNPVNANNYLMVSDAFALSYNRDKAIANWVAWRLTAGDLGDAERQNDFRPDDRLPAGWNRIIPADYTGSGFDRGHLCPSVDRSRSVEINSATFLMTNIAPQTPDLNQGPWEKLETYSRSIVRRFGNLYIVAGSYGTSRELEKSKITVPTNFWKIILILPPGTDISAINSDTRVIAVDMPNAGGIKEKNWRDYRTTAREIEQKTGNDFFSNLPKNIQNDLETKVDAR